MPLALTASASAASLITLPRVVLTRMAPSLRASKNAASTMCFVSGVAATCRLTTSLILSRFCRLEQ